MKTNISILPQQLWHTFLCIVIIHNQTLLEIIIYLVYYGHMAYNQLFVTPQYTGQQAVKLHIFITICFLWVDNGWKSPKHKLQDMFYKSWTEKNHVSSWNWSHGSPNPITEPTNNQVNQCIPMINGDSDIQESSPNLKNRSLCYSLYTYANNNKITSFPQVCHWDIRR